MGHMPAASSVHLLRIPGRGNSWAAEETLPWGGAHILQGERQPGSGSSGTLGLAANWGLSWEVVDRSAGVGKWAGRSLSLSEQAAFEAKAELGTDGLRVPAAPRGGP